MDTGRVIVERNGKTYAADFRVEKGMVTISSEFGSKTARVGGSPAELLARIMLGEQIGAEALRSKAPD